MGDALFMKCYAGLKIDMLCFIRKYWRFYQEASSDAGFECERTTRCRYLNSLKHNNALNLLSRGLVLNQK